MNDTLLKALVVLVPAAMLLGAASLGRRRPTTHFGGASRVSIDGLENSVGHYIDLCSAVVAATLFPMGYLLHALRTRL